MAQESKRRMKIEADTDDIVDLVKGAFESGPKSLDPASETNSTTLPKALSASSSMETPEDMRSMGVQGPQQSNTIERLKGLLDTPPTMEENKPSGLRRFGAAVAGGLTGFAGGPEAGMKTAGNILEQPYREEYQDWMTRTGALGKSAELDIELEKLENQGLTSYTNYLGRMGAIDPELQGRIAGAKKGAEEEALEPGREASDARRIEGQKAIESIRDIRAGKGRESTEGVAKANRESREKLSADQIKSLERRAKDSINSAENIAELRRKAGIAAATARSRNQRITPQQQMLARMEAEDQISKLISDEEEFEALFAEDPNTPGRYKLIPERDLDELWSVEYRDRRKEVDDLLKQILGSSFSPSADIIDGEEDEDIDYEIEEVE